MPDPKWYDLIDDAPTPVVSQAQSQDPFATQGSTGQRVFQSIARNVPNPVRVVEGLWNTVRHPINTAGNIIGAQVGQGRKAIENVRQGRYSEAAGHAGAALLPIIGPAAAEAGERIATGDVAGGLTDAALMVAAPGVARVAGAAMRAPLALAKKTARITIPESVQAATSLGMDPGAARTHLADVALRERGLQGLIRTGADRVSDRVNAGFDRVQSRLGSNLTRSKLPPTASGQMPVPAVTSVAAPEMSAAAETLGNRFANQSTLDAGMRTLESVRQNPRFTPGSQTAAQAVDLARGSRDWMLGDRTPGTMVERAAAQRALREVGQAVPAVAQDTSRLRDLIALEEAYTMPSHVTGGTLPTMKLRLAEAAGHRFLAPTAQGLYRVGAPMARLPTTNAMRAAFLMNLLEQQPESAASQ
jgi:hypothetical protein